MPVQAHELAGARCLSSEEQGVTSRGALDKRAISAATQASLHRGWGAETAVYVHPNLIICKLNWAEKRHILGDMKRDSLPERLSLSVHASHMQFERSWQRACDSGLWRYELAQFMLGLELI